jgi:hypothetical protein
MPQSKKEIREYFRKRRKHFLQIGFCPDHPTQKLVDDKHACAVCLARFRNKARARRKKLARQNQQKLIKYLKTHPCVDCGECDIRVLEFDHVRGKRKYRISSMVYSGRSWKNLLREIVKCDVRCANCHSLRTYKNNYRWER